MAISSSAPRNVSVRARASGSRRGRNRRASTSMADSFFVGGFFKVAVPCAAIQGAQVRAAAIVLGVDRDTGLAAVILAVSPPAGRHAQIQPPAVGPGDQAVGQYDHAVDGRQGSPDVQLMPGPVGSPHRVEHA